MTMFRDKLFAGKRILVTGGGTGLGEVMTEAYAKLGGAVYICGRRASVAEETARRISRDTGAAVKGFGCDIRVPESVDELLARIWEDVEAFPTEPELSDPEAWLLRVKP